MPRVLALSALLLGVTLLAVAVWAEPPAPPPPPQDLLELGRQLDQVTRRLAEISEMASRDPRWRDVEAYSAYGEREFEQRKRVEAEQLIELIADPEAELALREKAKDALLEPNPRTYDPDLIEKKGQRKPRNSFAMSKVVKHLEDEDATTRRLVQELLSKWFPRAGRDIEISAFAPESATRSQRSSVRKAWLKFLRK